MWKLVLVLLCGLGYAAAPPAILPKIPITFTVPYWPEAEGAGIFRHRLKVTEANLLEAARGLNQAWSRCGIVFEAPRFAKLALRRSRDLLVDPLEVQLQARMLLRSLDLTAGDLAPGMDRHVAFLAQYAALEKHLGAILWKKKSRVLGSKAHLHILVLPEGTPLAAGQDHFALGTFHLAPLRNLLSGKMTAADFLKADAIAETFFVVWGFEAGRHFETYSLALEEKVKIPGIRFLAHEVGHWLGLAHLHDPTEENLMSLRPLTTQLTQDQCVRARGFVRKKVFRPR